MQDKINQYDKQEQERGITITHVGKKETLEEAAERILANNIDGLRDALQDDDLFFFYKGVIQCYGEAMVEWQAERMYSEEIIDILDNVRYWGACPDNYKVIIEKFIEQFKKK
jgi:hypothetical protein